MRWRQVNKGLPSPSVLTFRSWRPASCWELGESQVSQPSVACQLLLHVLLRTLFRTFYDDELESSDRFYSNQHQLFQLCYALYNILAARWALYNDNTDSRLPLRYSDNSFLRSETVCYLVIVLNHMVSASCLTLVLPVLVFLWATLSVPRPSKTFWMTAIIYTEVHTTELSFIFANFN